MRAISPKSLVLDLLRVTPRDSPVPIRLLVEIGALFGLNDNAVRVAVARLMSAGLVDSHGERGSYRLSSRTRPLNRLIDEWRLGPRRTCAWRGHWIAIHVPRGLARADRRRTIFAMGRFGFAEGLEGMWVRPDNLAGSLRALELRLDGLGLDGGCELFAVRDAAPSLAAAWCRLWPIDKLQHDYKTSFRHLQRSAERVSSMACDRALVETFSLGGAAIRILARDPLLPDEITPSRPRDALTRAMLAYDELGRATWKKLLFQAAVRRAPGHALATRGLHG